MFRSLLLALALAACASRTPRDLPPPALPQRAGVDAIVAARAEGVEFRAVGHAPDFLLRIFRDDRVVLTWDTYEETFPKPAPIYPRWNGEIYETQTESHTLRIEIRRYLPCTDPNSEALPTTVIIVVDGEERRGCGQAL